MIEEREFENVHNVGKLAFGPTGGLLYFGNGDDAQVANHRTITRGLFAGLFRIVPTCAFRRSRATWSTRQAPR